VEIDPYRRQVLERHWPGVERHADITTTDPADLSPVDVLCGGFPCQDLSVAGTRAGLAGERSGLFFQFARFASVLRPRWILVENVPGLLSSNSGRDFLTVVDTLAKLGYGLQWRILDSQHFGVPQRRRRVYIAGHLGGYCPPEILFEPESLSGDTSEGCEAGSEVAPALRERADNSSRDGQDVAFTLKGGSGKRGWPVEFEAGLTWQDVAFALRRDPGGTGQGHNTNYVAALAENQQGEVRLAKIASSLNSGGGKPGQGYPAIAYALNGKEGNRDYGESETFVANTVPTHPHDRGDGTDNYVVNARQTPITGLPSLDTQGHSHAVAVRTAHTSANGIGIGGDQSHTLDGTGSEAVGLTAGVRRLTPTECEALQSFPRDWTKLDDKTPDGKRYAALGDAVTVNVIEWIGRRMARAIEATP
jgi:DNA (cytosine-5)-methyltransferase 1